MKTATLRALALLSLTATLSPFGLKAQGPTHFNLPFSFTAGAKNFDPGGYYVEEVKPHVLLVRSDRTNASTFLMGTAIEPGKASGMVTLTFNRYGDQYFLSKVADHNRGSKMAPSKGEKRLMAGQLVVQPATILADARN